MDLRVAVGRSGVLAWAAPCYLDGAATLTVQHPTIGDVQPVFAAVHEPVSIDAIGLDQRTLTLTDALDLPLDGIAGDSGDAYLRLPDGDVLEVTVNSVSSTTIRLADTLRRDVDVSAEHPATLQWATWRATVDGQLTATPRRDVPYVVTARALGGAAIEDTGAVDVVKRPFVTGVTLGALHRHRPALADAEYRRASHREAIEKAFDRLITWLRADLGAGRWEDDVFNGGDFRLVHLILAEAEVEDDPERASRLRSDAKGLYRLKTERVLKVSETGQAEEDEEDIGGADETHMAFGAATLTRSRW